MIDKKVIDIRIFNKVIWCYQQGQITSHQLILAHEYIFWPKTISTAPYWLDALYNDIASINKIIEIVHSIKMGLKGRVNRTGMGTKKLRYFILERDKHTCQSCGRKAPDVVIQVDHIFPVVTGGQTVPGNLQALCEECNTGKGGVLT